jgi:hypothetical protein
MSWVNLILMKLGGRIEPIIKQTYHAKFKSEIPKNQGLKVLSPKKVVNTKNTITFVL